MPSIPNALPPQAGGRSRRAEQGTRNTPTGGQSFDDYLNHANAAAKDSAPATRDERKPERAEKPREDGAAQTKNAPNTSDKQPAQPEEAPGDMPVVDGTQGDGTTGGQLPIPVCLAPQTPPRVERPIGDVIDAKPQVDQADNSAKLKAAIEWGDKPLHPGPAAAAPGTVQPTPKEPQICTSGPGVGSEPEKIDGPVVTVKEPVQAVVDETTPTPVDQSKPQPRSSGAAPKVENAPAAEKPQKPAKRSDSPISVRPEQREHRVDEKPTDAKPDLSDDVDPRVDRDSADQTPVRGRPVRGNETTTGRSEQTKSVHASKPDDGTTDTLKQVLRDMKVIGAEENRGDSQGATNPAVEIGRFLVPTDSRPQVSQSGVAAIGVERADRPMATGNESAGVKVPTAAAESTTAPISSDANMERLVKVLSGSGGESNWRVALQLDPPEMGRLHIHARMEDGGLSLNVAADNDAVRRTIESRMGELRDALGEHGIRLDAADVRVRAGSESGNGAAREHASGGQGESSPRGFTHGQSSQGNASSRGDGGSWQTPSGFGQSSRGEARQANPGWAGPMGLADVAATSETSVDLVA